MKPKVVITFTPASGKEFEQMETETHFAVIEDGLNGCTSVPDVPYLGRVWPKSSAGKAFKLWEFPSKDYNECLAEVVQKLLKEGGQS